MYNLSELFMEAFPAILGGSLITITIVIGALALGFFVGLPLAVVEVYGPRWAERIVGVYVWFFRGTPILVLLYLFYFGLFTVLGINLSNLAASCLVLGMTSAAYQSQIFRGSILAIPQGQLKAAGALGMTDGQAIRSVILPQALRLSIPAWTNEYSILLKDSALAFVLGTQEIMAKAHAIASRTQEHLPIYLMAGLIYFVITLVGVMILRHVERKMRIPGYASG